MSEYFQEGMTAADEGQVASDCPYPTGIRRMEWLKGFWSGKTPNQQQGKRRMRGEEGIRRSSGGM
jgi:ribosome modulation factor